MLWPPETGFLLVFYHIHVHLTIFVDGQPRQVPARGRHPGQPYTRNPRDIPLNANTQVRLGVGAPVVAPEKITFPNGL
jgi:hypothetical protein